LRERAYHSATGVVWLRNPATVLAKRRGKPGRRGVAGSGCPACGHRPFRTTCATAAAAESRSAAGTDDPDVGPGTGGEPGLTPAERLIGWNHAGSLLSLAGRQPGHAGRRHPPGSAHAHCQTAVRGGHPNIGQPGARRLRAHLDEPRFSRWSTVEPGPGSCGATRTDPEQPLGCGSRWASLARHRRHPAHSPAPISAAACPTDGFRRGTGACRRFWIPPLLTRPAAQHRPGRAPARLAGLAQALA